MQRPSIVLGQATPGSAASLFSRLTRSASFYFIRHGESEGNARGMVQGHWNAPLNEVGRDQAKASVEWFSSLGVRTLYCSPLSRAAETAAILAEGSGQATTSVEPLFREIDTGVFSGRVMAEVRVEMPEVYRRYEELSWDGVPGAEGSDELYRRALECWEFAIERAESGDAPFATVSHGGLIQWIVRSSFGCRSWFPLVPTGNCGVFELEANVTESGVARLFWKKLNWLPYGPIPSKAQAF
jgi:broad specificity phosphatase PhoE